MDNVYIHPCWWIVTLARLFILSIDHAAQNCCVPFKIGTDRIITMEFEGYRSFVFPHEEEESYYFMQLKRTAKHYYVSPAPVFFMMPHPKSLDNSCHIPVDSLDAIEWVHSYARRNKGRNLLF